MGCSHLPITEAFSSIQIGASLKQAGLQTQVGPHICKRRLQVSNILENRDSDVFVDHYHYTGRFSKLRSN